MNYLYFVIMFVPVITGFGAVEVKNMSVLAVVPAGYGHMYPVICLLEELVMKGHQVTLFTGQSQKFNFPSSIEVVRFPETEEAIAVQQRGQIPDFNTVFTLFKASNSPGLVKMMLEFEETHKVDIVISDVFAFSATGVGKKWGVPTVSIHYTLDWFTIMNSYTPSSFDSSSARSMSLTERMINYLSSTALIFNYALLMRTALSHIDEFNLDFDSPPELVLVPSEFGLLPAHDTPPFVKVIGPLFQPARYISDPEIEQILSSAEQQGKDVIYVSFGTVGFLPKDRVPIFVKALARLNQTIIVWAITNEASRKMLPEELPSSIHIKGHVPQLQLLNHTAVKLFISHCGANSANEAAYHGVPVLAVPLFADQPRYASQLAYLNMAEIIDFNTFTEDEVVHKIQLLLEEEYQQNAEKVSRLLQSSGGVKEAAWHIERLAYVGVHDYYVPERYNVNWIIQNHIDIWINFALIIFVLYKLSSCGIQCCRRKKL